MKIEELVELWSKKIAKNTQKLYLHNLTKLNEGSIPDSTDYLLDTKKILEKVDSVKNPKSRKTYITSVLSALRYVMSRDDPTFQRYTLYLEQLARAIRQEEDGRNGEKTEKETKNWLDYSKIKEKVAELKKDVEGLKNPMSKAQKQKLLQYFVLTLYTAISPRRSLDFALASVVKKYSPDMPNDINYISLQDKKFVFNQFKTKGAFGQQVISYKNNKEMEEAVALFVRLMGLTPTKDNPVVPLFPSQNSGFITRVLNSIWKSEGKKISTSLLRHIFLSDKYDLKQMEADSESMAHDLKTQRDYLRKD